MALTSLTLQLTCSSFALAQSVGVDLFPAPNKLGPNNRLAELGAVWVMVMVTVVGSSKHVPCNPLASALLCCAL